MSASRRHDTDVNDAATRDALDNLALSRSVLVEYARDLAAPRGGSAAFAPRSATLRALMSVGRLPLPWIRWAFSAFLLLRSIRKK